MKLFIDLLMAHTTFFIGFKPVRYRCVIAECDDPSSPFALDQSHELSSEHKSIFVADSKTETLNFCKRRPLNSTMMHVRGKCTIHDFDLTGDPVLCDATETNVLFDDMPMMSTIVTEFNLFCNEEYKAKFYLKHD